VSPDTVIGKVVAVMEALAEPRRVCDVSRLTRLPQSTAYRILNELIQHGWVGLLGDHQVPGAGVPVLVLVHGVLVAAVGQRGEAHERAVHLLGRGAVNDGSSAAGIHHHGYRYARRTAWHDPTLGGRSRPTCGTHPKRVRKVTSKTEFRALSAANQCAPCSSRIRQSEDLSEGRACGKEL
jgi:hypothetical protein